MATAIRILSRLALALVCAFAGTSAIAQFRDHETPTGSKVPRPIPAEELETAETRMVQAKFGDCLVRKHPAEAKLLVLRYPTVRRGDSAGKKLIQTLSDGDCLIEALAPRNVSLAKFKLPGDSLWYILAEALFRSELAAAPILSQVQSRAPLQHPTLDETEFTPAGSKPRKADLQKLSKQRSDTANAVYLSQFGECVVRANPAGTYRLLNSGIRSAEENAAFDALSSMFKSCLLDEYSLVLNRFSVRGTLAYAYYRLAYAAPPVAPIAVIKQ